MTDLARISGPDHNADLGQLVTIDSSALPWRGTAAEGVTEKLFERIAHGAEARETALLRLMPGAALPSGRTECRVDVFVLQGAVQLSGQLRPEGSYVRIPKGDEVAVRSAVGATLMVKKRGGAADGEPLALDTRDRANWAAWGGRGSEKAQLFNPGVLPEASWVGFMLPDLTIPEHSHAGGEEIFILEGELRDERGHYGPGTWVRFPVGVTHTPTSLSEGCLMLVREGDACRAS
jgi:hypothetical protein